MITIINTQADSISGSLGISQQRRNELVDAFIAQEAEWRAAENEDSTRHLFNRLLALANTEAEQCYICCMYGRFIEREDNPPSLTQVIFKERT